LNVGQCGFDHQAISLYLAEEFRAQVERSDTLDEARHALQATHYDLVLVNRVLDLDGSSGLDLIRSLKQDPDPAVATVPVMLVSDYPSAQKEAITLGAAPGFGKSELHAPETSQRIMALLGA
jgi:DNA-binding response OmpR family regulator